MRVVEVLGHGGADFPAQESAKGPGQMKQEILAFGASEADEAGTPAAPVCHVARLQRIISFIRSGGPALHDAPFISRVLAGRAAPQGQTDRRKQTTMI